MQRLEVVPVYRRIINARNELMFHHEGEEEEEDEEDAATFHGEHSIARLCFPLPTSKPNVLSGVCTLRRPNWCLAAPTDRPGITVVETAKLCERVCEQLALLSRVAVGMEGVDIGRHGTVSLMQVRVSCFCIIRA